ncbi:MAG: hypothetical protein KF729_28950 [Sandaracinaceae bacterium]|nr:hypothetical protein [Sandaracinaceae bacterium]
MSAEWSELSDYLAGALAPDAEADLERELFDDASAAAVATAFLAVVDGIASIRAHYGTLGAGLSARGLEELRARGAEIAEFTIEPGETVRCVIDEGVAICVGHLRLPPDADARRVDVEYVDPTGAIYGRARDIPVDRDAGRVSLACDRHVALSTELGTFRLLARADGGWRVVGTYAVENVRAPA